MKRAASILVLTAMLMTTAIQAQQESDGSEAAPAQPPPVRYPCQDSDNHRAFDFWIGTWDVKFQGNHAGVNEIRPILGDCVLFENWDSAGGNYTGKSFNYYDAAEGHWRQIWIDDRGGVIEFTGEVRDGAMYYTANTKNPADGSEIRHKLTFTQNPDGSVRQLWEQSNDGGDGWNTVWDGHYVRQD